MRREGEGRGTRANVVLKREEREVKGRVFAAFGTPPELGNISEDSASLLRLFRAPLPLRQHCGYNLVLFIPSRMSKYFQPSPNLPFPLTLLPPSPPLSFSLSLARPLALSLCAILSSTELILAATFYLALMVMYSCHDNP